MTEHPARPADTFPCEIAPNRSAWRPFNIVRREDPVAALRGWGVLLFWCWGGQAIIVLLAVIMHYLGREGGLEDSFQLGIFLSPLALLMGLVGALFYYPWFVIGNLRALDGPGRVLVLSIIGAVLLWRAPPLAVFAYAPGLSFFALWQVLIDPVVVSSMILLTLPSLRPATEAS